jgi:rRNA biogenesis protein RRP5
MSLGLKPSYFADLDADMDGDESSSEDNEEDDGVSNASENLNEDEGENAEGAIDSDSDAQSVIHLGVNSEDDTEDDDENEAMNVDIPPLDGSLALNQASASKSTSVPTLSLHGGFQWSGNAENGGESDFASSSDEDEDDDGNQSKRKKKHKRKEIEQDLTATMHTKMPESNADFERVLLGSPNSSFIWIQYMSFQLQMSEIDKAREIGKRALGVINFREEQEKLNVWIALLNLENVYGTDESLEVTFKDAARHNDSKTIHLRLAGIFDQTEKSEVFFIFAFITD